jgi:hypothetical protein
MKVLILSKGFPMLAGSLAIDVSAAPPPWNHGLAFAKLCNWARQPSSRRDRGNRNPPKIVYS